MTLPTPRGPVGMLSIPPNGKRFAIGMATIGHWTGTTRDHKWLFRDHHEFLKQVGLAQ